MRAALLGHPKPTEAESTRHLASRTARLSHARTRASPVARYIFVGIATIFPLIANTITCVTDPLFASCRQVLEQMFPPLMVDLDGNGAIRVYHRVPLECRSVPFSAAEGHSSATPVPLSATEWPLNTTEWPLMIGHRAALAGTPDFRVPDGSAFLYYAKGAITPVLFFMAVQIIFAYLFLFFEPQWDYGRSIYHCIVTATTVGYGDVPILTQEGEALACVHILISVSLLAAMIADVDGLRQTRRSELKRGRQFLERINVENILSLDVEGNGVDKFEFVIGMLIRLEAVEPADVSQFMAQVSGAPSCRLERRGLPWGCPWLASIGLDRPGLPLIGHGRRRNLR